MSHSAWHVTDLSAIAAWLRSTKRHRRLVGMIDRAAAAGTIREDLREAQRCHGEIERIQAGREGPEEDVDQHEVTVTGALFSHAVVLYARATFSSSKQRQPLLGEDHLTPELRRAHKAVKALRNAGVAHYGRAEFLDNGPLVREAVVFGFWREGDRVREQVNVLSTRAQAKAGVRRQLGNLLVAQLAHLAKSEQNYLTAVREELERAVREDADLGRALPRHPFDPYAFCATPAAALWLSIGLQRGVIDDYHYAAEVPPVN